MTRAAGNIDAVVERVLSRLREAVPATIKGAAGEAVTPDEAAVCALLDQLIDEQWYSACLKVERLEKGVKNLLVFKMSRAVTPESLDERGRLLQHFVSMLGEQGFSCAYLILPPGADLDVARLARSGKDQP